MYKDLKQQLLGVIGDIYIRSLKKNYTRYGNHTCLKVIYHLKPDYYNIILADLKLNMARMNALHNINELFETINDQIEIAFDFDDARKVL